MVWRVRVIFFKKLFEIYGSRFIRRSVAALAQPHELSLDQGIQPNVNAREKHV